MGWVGLPRRRGEERRSGGGESEEGEGVRAEQKGAELRGAGRSRQGQKEGGRAEGRRDGSERGVKEFLYAAGTTSPGFLPVDLSVGLPACLSVCPVEMREVWCWWAGYPFAG